MRQQEFAFLIISLHVQMFEVRHLFCSAQLCLCFRFSGTVDDEPNFLGALSAMTPTRTDVGASARFAVQGFRENRRAIVKIGDNRSMHAFMQCLLLQRAVFCVCVCVRVHVSTWRCRDGCLDRL